MTGKEQGLGKEERIRKRGDFLRVQRRGERFVRKCLIFLFKKNGLHKSRLGITVSRKVGGAVERNRIKRWVREAFRRRKHRLVKGLDVVVIAKKKSSRGSLEEVEGELEEFVEHLSSSGGKRAIR
jgi:ribonuclease P protein component